MGSQVSFTSQLVPIIDLAPSQTDARSHLIWLKEEGQSQTIKYGLRGDFSLPPGYIIIYLKIINQRYPQETKACFTWEPGRREARAIC